MGESLLFVGDLDKSKGVQLIVEVMPIIIKAIGDVKLKIVGAGPIKHELEEKNCSHRSRALGRTSGVRAKNSKMCLQ